VVDDVASICLLVLALSSSFMRSSRSVRSSFSSSVALKEAAPSIKAWYQMELLVTRPHFSGNVRGEVPILTWMMPGLLFGKLTTLSGTVQVKCQY